MNTQELIKETESEAQAGIERAAKNVNELGDEINRLREEVKELTNANYNLRARILEFSKWSTDAVEKRLPRELIAVPDIRDEAYVPIRPARDNTTTIQDRGFNERPSR